MKKNLAKALFGFTIFMALFTFTAVSHENHESMHGDARAKRVHAISNTRSVNNEYTKENIRARTGEVNTAVRDLLEFQTCILASSQIAACPDGNALQMIAFHINGIRSLAQAIFFIFVFICIAGAVQIFSKKFFRTNRFRKNWWKMETDGEIFEESIKNWISIRKKAAA